MITALIWIFGIIGGYFFLSLLGIVCFEISLKIDKTNIEERRKNFNKIFLFMGWLMPFLILQKLLTGKYKKSEG